MTRGMTGQEPDPREVYADIIGHPHHVSPTRPRMSLEDRAAQFAPFAALTGYGDMIDEEAREVGAFEALSETEMEILNAKINRISEALENGQHPVLKFTYFIADIAKTGGSYVSITERVRRVDTVGKKIQLFKKIGLSGSYMELDMDKINAISGELVDGIE